MTTYGTFSRTIYTTSGSTSEDYTMYGRSGSTITDELNRLANGGEYPTKDTYLADSGALNKWVNVPNGTGMPAALAYACGFGYDVSQYRDVKYMVNYLLELIKEAGTGEGEPVDYTNIELQPSNLLDTVTALRLIAS